jgi:hypothetical protein
MFARPFRVISALGLMLVIACRDSTAPPVNGAITVGQSLSVTGGRSFALTPGATSGEYVAVLVNTGLKSGVSESYTFSGDALGTPTFALAPTGGATLDRAPVTAGAPDAPVLDQAFEAGLRARERAELTPRFADARAWYAARSGKASTLTSPDGLRTFDVSRRDAAIPSTAKVGDTVTVNVNGLENCTNPVYHQARVAAIGTKAIILDDLLNPKPGFLDADFVRYAAKFDTLIYPLDVAAFGTPTDIDNNGHIVIIFTRAVNELTPAASATYIGGFTFSRDLFPVTTVGRLQGCASSNVGEFFYLLTPDPAGTINRNPRSTAFVDSNTTAVVAHEFQHLINSSRRLYVNDANSFESKWLDEGLAHIAEELLFYREAGVPSRSNLGTTEVRATTKARTAFNLDMFGNAGRYRSYLQAPQKSSPYAEGDSLSTRGAAWDLLRYLADRAGPSDGDIFLRLVNSKDSGMVNVSAVFGADFGGLVRDWSTSHAVDDIFTTAAEFQQPSWNWHSLYVTMNGAYPLPMTTMTTGAAYTGTVTAGGATYFKLAVAAGGSGGITLSQPNGGGGNLQLVIVRVK